MGVPADKEEINGTTYAYSGSLTTPPCTEGVLWRMLAQPVETSAKQLAAFHAIYDGNNRHIQPMNDREFN